MINLIKLKCQHLVNLILFIIFPILFSHKHVCRHVVYYLENMLIMARDDQALTEQYRENLVQNLVVPLFK
jgi:exopolysaccharide biosynthesis protein